jgi:hypothetical protein
MSTLILKHANKNRREPKRFRCMNKSKISTGGKMLRPAPEIRVLRLTCAAATSFGSGRIFTSHGTSELTQRQGASLVARGAAHLLLLPEWNRQTYFSQNTLIQSGAGGRTGASFAMSELSSNSDVVHPRCWWCWASPMALKRIDPRLDHYKGRFECETCGRTKRRVIRIKSPSISPANSARG